MLHDVEAFEVGAAEIEAAVGAGALVRLAEGFGPGPVLERSARVPDRVRGVERVVLALRPPQQMELDEARHLAQVAVALAPDALELRLAAQLHLEAVHGDEHGSLLSGRSSWRPAARRWDGPSS